MFALVIYITILSNSSIFIITDRYFTAVCLSRYHVRLLYTPCLRLLYIKVRMPIDTLIIQNIYALYIMFCFNYSLLYISN